MASAAARNRRSPVARFNTFEQPDDEIKAQIGYASHTQRALRHRQLFHPRPSHSDLQPAGLQRNSRSFDGATRPDSVSLAIDTERHSLDRTYSFNSLSTLQRETEAARQSQYRDSPVSAYVPSDRTAPFAIDQKIELEDPCPPIGVYTLKQARKDRRDEKRSAKKKEKQQKKDDKNAAHRRRASEVQILTPAANQKANSEVPKRAASDPSSFRASKEAAIQLVKRLTTTKSRLIRKRSKNEDVAPPHVDDFRTKPDLQEYLNPSLPETAAGIAELPGPLPPYTPFQNATRSEDNAPVSHLEPVTASPVYRSHSNPHGCDSPEASRMMRCDHCQFGIKLDEKYFHCSICNSGDRIVCGACDASGLSCRHELTERVRRVLSYDHGVRQRSASRHGPRRRQTTPATFSSPDDVSRIVPVTATLAQAELQSAPAINANTTHVLRERQFQLELKELDMRKREQEITLKERETILKEREATLRIRQAEADAQGRQQEANTHILMTQLAEMASLGAQFARSQSQKSASSGDEDILADHDDKGIRQHAGKRKSGSGRSAATSAKTSALTNKTTQRRLIQQAEAEENEEEDDDDTGAGTPKKPRLDTDAALGEVLYACHFCKFNGQRYSERNNSEKQYRGCSSGYWPDISRLKQHLYRVHWRGRHCRRCYKTFKSEEELGRHAREATACTMRECPFPEKFDDNKYNEIKRKRPTTSPEDVWFIIYEILFPGHERPASPFADSTSTEAASASASTPPNSTQQSLSAAQQIFEARLDQRRDVPWLQQPGARELLREELQASMADVIRSMLPLTVHTQCTHTLSGERSPMSTTSPGRASRPSLHLLSSFGPSIDASPDPGSATSTHSVSSGHLLLPGHRHSFSRPFSAKGESSHEPTLISATDTTPSEIVFRAPTPVDAESDGYDSESHSWQKGDESLGLAITTLDGFDFNLDNELVAESPMNDPNAWVQESASSAPRMVPAPAFKPVKVASLANHPSAEAAVDTSLKPNISNASADSGYGSRSPRPLASTPRTQRRNRGKSHTAPPDMDMTRQDHSQDSGVDLEALDVSYHTFSGVGAEIDECGNVNGRSLTDYLYSDAF